MPPVPPVPVHELFQLSQGIERMRASINVQEIEEEDEFTTRVRNSSRMLNNMLAQLASQRRNSTPRNEISADEMVDVNRARGRQHRVASVPDQRVVEQVRQEERERGGPSAPRNSLDLSAISVNEIIDVNDESDADGGNIDEDSILRDLDGHEQENNPSIIHNINEYVNFQMVPPLTPMNNAPLIPMNALEGEESEANTLDMTIDLTESPVRSVRPMSISTRLPVLLTPPRSQNVVSSSSPVSSPMPKCPVCLESFRSVHSRGHRLVSTLCGHVFCGRCLPACVRTSGHCPTCRKRIGYEDFHPLFLF